MSRERRHEPFTPRVPEFIRSHTTLFGAVMTMAGIFGSWVISNQMAGWPDWMLFPSMALAVVSLVAMIIGLGILTVRLLEPVLSVMDLDWDAEPLAELGIPLPLQRKCEAIGYWTAEDLVRDVVKGKFPWTKLDYTERMQIQQATDRWKLVESAEKRRRRGQWLLTNRRKEQPAGRTFPGNDRGL